VVRHRGIGIQEETNRRPRSRCQRYCRPPPCASHPQRHTPEARRHTPRPRNCRAPETRRRAAANSSRAPLLGPPASVAPPLHQRGGPLPRQRPWGRPRSRGSPRKWSGAAPRTPASARCTSGASEAEQAAQPAEDPRSVGPCPRSLPPTPTATATSAGAAAWLAAAARAGAGCSPASLPPRSTCARPPEPRRPGAHSSPTRRGRAATPSKRPAPGHRPHHSVDSGDPRARLHDWAPALFATEPHHGAEPRVVP